MGPCNTPKPDVRYQEVKEPNVSISQEIKKLKKLVNQNFRIADGAASRDLRKNSSAANFSKNRRKAIMGAKPQQGARSHNKGAKP